MGSPVQAFIALGANLGDAPATLKQAIKNLANLPGTELLRASSLYRTAPVDATGPDFINAVALVRTELKPHALLTALQAQEHAQGRLRPYRNAPRTLDLDILCMFDAQGELRMQDSTLTLPHPRMHERRFALEPLVEICPGCIIPRIGPAAQALARVCDQDVARKGDPA